MNKIIVWWIFVICICSVFTGFSLYFTWSFSNVKYLTFLTSCCFWLLKIFSIFVLIVPYLRAKFEKKLQDCCWSTSAVEVFKSKKSKLETLKAIALQKFNLHSMVDDKVELKQKVRLQDLVNDLLMFAIFFAALNVLILGTRDSNGYFSTKMVESIFVTPKSHGLHSVDTDEKLISYINQTVILNTNSSKFSIH